MSTDAPQASLDAMELVGMTPHQRTARLIGNPLVCKVLSDLLDESITDEDATDVRVRIMRALKDHGGTR